MRWRLEFPARRTREDRMSVRLVLFTLGPGKREIADALASDLGPQIRGLPGCDSATFFGDDSDSQYGIVVLWDSQENADAASAVIAPQLQGHLAGNVTEPPTRRLYRVIDAG